MKLAQRISLRLFAITAVVMTSYFLIESRRLERELRETFSSSNVTLLSNGVPLLAQGLWNFDPEVIFATAKGFFNEPNVTKVIVTNAKGEVSESLERRGEAIEKAQSGDELKETGSGELSRPLAEHRKDSKALFREKSLPGGTILYFSPIFADKDSKFLGHMVVSMSTRKIDEKVSTDRLHLLVFCAALGVITLALSYLFIHIEVIRPLGNVTGASEKIARGVFVRIDESQEKSDEFRSLLHSFNAMIDILAERARYLAEISNGDLRAETSVASAEDQLGLSMQRMRESLRDIVRKITETTQQVAIGARELDSASSALSQGASSQIAAIQQISVSVSRAQALSGENAAGAESAKEAAAKTIAATRTGIGEMQETTRAMEQIAEASRAVNKVLKVIDDIAFQTNLLALNASVEAARAGRHGKGFAVVADEVRNLAGRSTQAAQESAKLIGNAVEKSENGKVLMERSFAIFSSVTSEIEALAARLDEIAGKSRESSLEVVKVAKNVKEIDDVIQRNTAFAEETAATAQTLASQAETARNAVSTFRL